MYQAILIICQFMVFVSRARCEEISNLSFPESFRFGTATSAYQIEGGWNASGKGVSYFDYSTHNHPYIYVDGSNGDIACDSYHKYQEDIEMLKNLKVGHYRFSVAWTRLLPTGFSNRINQDGVDYYNKLIDGLLEAGIEPWVTMYHWDIPKTLDNLGGWTQSRIVDYFTDYADLLFSLYGDRVKTWITINEPSSFCYEFINEVVKFDTTRPIGIYEYLCSYYVLKTHTSVYRLYQRKYKSAQKGRISMAFVAQAYLPATNSLEDIEAAERMRQFTTGLYLHPLIHGNYPKVVRDVVNSYSATQGFPQSRLPPFTLQEIYNMKGAVDFLGINHYTTYLVQANNTIVDRNPSIANDHGLIQTHDPSWESTASSWFKVYPPGFRAALNWIKDNYENPEIVILEQGFSDYGELNDIGRVNYYKLYLNEALKAMHEDDVRLTGYTAWSLMDNFEWNQGYTAKFGLYQVDFSSDDRTRTPKESVSFYRKLYLSEALKAIHVDKVRLTGYTPWSLLDNFEWISGYSIKFGLYQVDFSSENRTRTAKASASFYRDVIATRCLVDQCA